MKNRESCYIPFIRRIKRVFLFISYLRIERVFISRIESEASYSLYNKNKDPLCFICIKNRESLSILFTFGIGSLYSFYMKDRESLSIFLRLKIEGVSLFALCIKKRESLLMFLLLRTCRSTMMILYICSYYIVFKRER